MFTEQVHAQISLRESEERFRMFSEETREGVVIHDGRTVLDCNSALLGCSATTISRR
jgi:PAS domain-containing protein